VSPTTKRLTVDQYDQMVENWILPQAGEIAVADLLPQVKGGGR
jgi:hypothetical protein